MSKLELYHVSFTKYDIRSKFTLSTHDETFYYKMNKEKGINWVDDFLNLNRPSSAPLRHQTFYSFDSLANCHRYIRSINKIKKIAYYYKIEMQNPFKAPMCLTDLILKAGSQNTLIDGIANEYWHPSFNWKFYEYLSNEMLIVEDIKEPNLLAQIQGDSNYNFDIDLRKKHFVIQ